MCNGAAMIGGTNIGSYGGVSVTELDSYANIAVARRDCTMPIMEMVEIEDVALAYNNHSCARHFCSYLGMHC